MSITISIWNLLFLFAAFNGILLCLLLMGTPSKRNYEPNRWIVAGILTFVCILSINLGYWNHLNTTIKYIHINQSYWPFTFLIAPFMYIYLEKQIRPDQKTALGHFALPVLALLLLLPFYLKSGAEKIDFYIQQQHLTPYYINIGRFLVVSSIIQLLGYITMIFFLIKKNNNQQQLNTEAQKQNQWLNQLAISFSIYGALYILYYILVQWSGFIVEWDYLISLAMVGTIYFIGMKAYHLPQLFKEREVLELLQKKKSNQLILPEKNLVLKANILKIMEEQSPHLNDKLKLSELAEILDLTPHQLSYFLNRNMQTNFSDFINTYRITAAKNMLLDPQKSHFKIISIGYDAGFSSKTAFYSTFKKFEGMSPTAFRNQANASTTPKPKHFSH